MPRSGPTPSPRATSQQRRPQVVIALTVGGVLFGVLVSAVLAMLFLKPSERWHKEATVTEPPDGCLTIDCRFVAEKMLPAMNQSAQPCDDFYEYMCGNYSGPEVNIFSAMTDLREWLATQRLDFFNITEDHSYDAVDALVMFSLQYHLPALLALEVDRMRFLNKKRAILFTLNKDDIEWYTYYHIANETNKTGRRSSYEAHLSYYGLRGDTLKAMSDSLEAYGIQGRWASIFGRYTGGIYHGEDYIQVLPSAPSLLVALLSSPTIGTHGLRCLLAWSVLRWVGDLVNAASTDAEANSRSFDDVCYDHLLLVMEPVFMRKYDDINANTGAARRARGMIGNIKAAFKRFLFAFNWMGEEVDNLMDQKLADMSALVGYPDSTPDAAGLNDYYGTSFSSVVAREMTKIMDLEAMALDQPTAVPWNGSDTAKHYASSARCLLKSQKEPQPDVRVWKASARAALTRRHVASDRGRGRAPKRCTSCRASLRVSSRLPCSPTKRAERRTQSTQLAWACLHAVRIVVPEFTLLLRGHVIGVLWSREERSAGDAVAAFGAGVKILAVVGVHAATRPHATQSPRLTPYAPRRDAARAHAFQRVRLVGALDVNACYSVVRVQLFRGSVTKFLHCPRRVRALDWVINCSPHYLYRFCGAAGAYAAFTVLPKEERAVRLHRSPLSSDQTFYAFHCAKLCEMNGNASSPSRQAAARLRCVLPLMNSEAFAETFNCPSSSPMNPLKKCSIW
ncbi:hypothetical protein HPB49_025189 [Dermacentor silvarum]|uniref:Uncharacterized protein n=1 Tax=Dermacentor silvarum TaxID=543639 RepID=A0ACB8D957_DERSI|nr:hypothetical protein HPB49_025189 [Dermacentor silvarum]